MTMNDMSGPQLQRLAKSLAQAFQIHHGDNLVFVLGEGTERDNVDALITWVRDNLQDPDFQMAKRVLPLLTERLERQLRLEEWPS